MGREFILNGSYKLWEGSTHDATQSIRYNMELKDTAKKLCNTKTFISTSYN